MFAALRDFLEQRRFQADVRKLHAQTKSFVDSIRELARRDNCQAAMKPMEILILANFLIAEIYHGFSSNRAFASDVLDAFHKSSAEAYFNANLQSFQKNFPNHDATELYDQFMKLFFDRTRERYTQYREITLDENGLFKFSERHFSDLGSHLLSPTHEIGADERELLIFKFGLVVMGHMSHCAKIFKR